MAKKMFIDCVNFKLEQLVDMHVFVSIMVALFLTYPGIVITADFETVQR